MSRKAFFCYAFSITALALAIAIVPHDALARAGGGSSKSGNIFDLILLPFLLIYSGIIAYLVAKKSRQAKEVLNISSKQDPAWNAELVQTRIEDAFYKIEIAWRDRNQEGAKDYMSQRLYNKHKLQTDDMLSRGIKNVMENINLIEAKIVDVADYKDDSKDFFWVLIKGSMIDYTIVEKTGDIIDGEKKNNSFKELWRFKREQHGWVVDEIDPKVSISDLRNFHSFSEADQSHST